MDKCFIKQFQISNKVKMELMLNKQDKIKKKTELKLIKTEILLTA